MVAIKAGAKIGQKRRTDEIVCDWELKNLHRRPEIDERKKIDDVLVAPFHRLAHFRHFGIPSSLDRARSRVAEASKNVQGLGICRVTIQRVNPPTWKWWHHETELYKKLALCKHIGIMSISIDWSKETSHEPIWNGDRLEFQAMTSLVTAIGSFLEVCGTACLA